MPCGALVDLDAQPFELGVVQRRQSIDLAVEGLPIGPVGVVVTPFARRGLSLLVADPHQFGPETDELFGTLFRAPKPFAPLRLEMRLPIRHVGFELAQKCFHAVAELGPVGRDMYMPRDSITTA